MPPDDRPARAARPVSSMQEEGSVLRPTLIGALVVAALAAALPATASADTGAQAFAQLAAQPQGRVTINVRVTRFASTASGPRATGVATATLNGLGGTPTTVRQKVNLAV